MKKLPNTGSQTAAELVEAEPRPPIPAEIVAPGSDWETVATGYVYSDAPAADAQGEIYYSTNAQMRIYHLNANDELNVFDENTQLTMGLMFGPDGRLYGCRNRDAQIVAYDMQGNREVLLQGELTPVPKRPDAPAEFCNDLVINSLGQIWFTDRLNRGVVYLAPDGSSRVVAEGFRSNGIALSADEKILAVTDSNEPKLWAFDVKADGSLIEKADFFAPIVLVEKIGPSEASRDRPGTNGMTIDSDGRFYVTSFYGIQIFDATGSYVGVIPPATPFMSNITFGGPDFSVLYATGLKGVFRLQTKVQGAPYFLRANSD